MWIRCIDSQFWRWESRAPVDHEASPEGVGRVVGGPRPVADGGRRLQALRLDHIVERERVADRGRRLPHLGDHRGGRSHLVAGRQMAPVDRAHVERDPPSPCAPHMTSRP
jgi:hypothetical protein